MSNEKLVLKSSPVSNVSSTVSIKQASGRLFLTDGTNFHQSSVVLGSVLRRARINFVWLQKGQYVNCIELLFELDRFSRGSR